MVLPVARVLPMEHPHHDVKCCAEHSLLLVIDSVMGEQAGHSATDGLEAIQRASAGGVVLIDHGALLQAAC